MLDHSVDEILYTPEVREGGREGGREGRERGKRPDPLLWDGFVFVSVVGAMA